MTQTKVQVRHVNQTVRAAYVALQLLELGHETQWPNLLNSRSNCVLGSIPGQEYCVVFLGKTLYCHV